VEEGGEEQEVEDSGVRTVGLFSMFQ